MDLLGRACRKSWNIAASVVGRSYSYLFTKVATSVGVAGHYIIEILLNRMPNFIELTFAIFASFASLGAIK